ncbi:MAG: hypothetical protein WC099_03245 [Candidatus Paceibacterota bacterium]
MQQNQQKAFFSLDSTGDTTMSLENNEISIMVVDESIDIETIATLGDDPLITLLLSEQTQIQKKKEIKKNKEKKELRNLKRLWEGARINNPGKKVFFKKDKMSVGIDEIFPSFVSMKRGFNHPQLKYF